MIRNKLSSIKVSAPEVAQGVGAILAIVGMLMLLPLGVVLLIVGVVVLAVATLAELQSKRTPNPAPTSPTDGS